MKSKMFLKACAVASSLFLVATFVAYRAGAIDSSQFLPGSKSARPAYDRSLMHRPAVEPRKEPAAAPTPPAVEAEMLPGSKRKIIMPGYKSDAVVRPEPILSGSKYTTILTPSAPPESAPTSTPAPAAKPTGVQQPNPDDLQSKAAGQDRTMFSTSKSITITLPGPVSFAPTEPAANENIIIWGSKSGSVISPGGITPPAASGK